MAKAPVNSFNTELLSALKTSLLEAQNSRSKGVILTSSLPTIFSAGLDITVMFSDKKGLIDYWQTLQDTWLTLYSLSIPTAAAINVQIFFFSNVIHAAYLWQLDENIIPLFQTGLQSCWRLSNGNIYRIQSFC